MPDPNVIDRVLRRHALDRFGRFAPLPLQNLDTPSLAFATLPDPLVEFYVRYRDAVCRWLGSDSHAGDAGVRGEALAFFVDHMTGVVLSKNQFVVIGQDQNDEMAEMYRQFLRDFRNVLLATSREDELSQALGGVLAAHQADLAAFVHGLAASNGGLSFVYSEPVCAEYTPELQLSILHTLPEQMKEPVLDLGCGHEASLVHYLRRRGKAAFGIDRLARPGAFVARVDWFDYPLGASRWGTVISHMGLSNHFMHHHLRPDGHPERYARRFMEVLRALKPGGSFLYAPGLPFFEDLLPADRYLVDRFPVSTLPIGPADAVQDPRGSSVSYSCRVLKRPNP